MKTLTITERRGRLGHWLKKAAQGDDIGFVVDGKIVTLRPVEVISTDYALQEYSLTPKEMEAAERRIHAELKSARTRGELTPFTGRREDFNAKPRRLSAAKPQPKEFYRRKRSKRRTGKILLKMRNSCG